MRKKKPIYSEWEKVIYCVFDAPEHRGDFRERIKYCKEVLKGNRVARVVKHHKIKSPESMDKYYQKMVDLDRIW